jgi:peptidoglycan/LPS O-acetylase OafA/YrhL
MRTIADQIDATGNNSTGFNYLRLILALCVVAWHSILASYGIAAEAPYWDGPVRPLLFAILPGFFALAGFLVAGSLNRVPDLTAFLTLRGLRVFPALTCEVVLSAILLGPALTATSLTAYFGDPTFFAYFLNISGWIHYKLPGVFGSNPYPSIVNVQLWTVPYELGCYLVLAGLAAVGLMKRRNTLTLLVAIAFIVGFLRNYYFDSFPQFVAGPSVGLLFLSFLLGVLLHMWRDKVPHSPTLFVVSLLFGVIFVSFRETTHLFAIPVAYVIVFLGLLNPRRLWFIDGSDYSYGVFLYGFPIQQSVSYVFPGHRAWLFNFVVSAALSLLCAHLSWTLLESKALDRRKAAIAYATSVRTRLLGLFTGEAYGGLPAQSERDAEAGR